MQKDRFSQSPDFTKNAAQHLQVESENNGLKIRSSHAHALVAAWLGYNSRAALLAHSSDHSTDDPWLYKERPNLASLDAAIGRMRETTLQASDVPFIARTIQNGLAPACSETGVRSASNIPLGRIDSGERVGEEVWVSKQVAEDPNLCGHCRCCGTDYVYPMDALDENMLCDEHRGEFDVSPEEEEDMNDFVENLTKDL